MNNLKKAASALRAAAKVVFFKGAGISCSGPQKVGFQHFEISSLGCGRGTTPRGYIGA